MAYVSDDPKPMRPKKASSSKDDVALENCADIRPSDEMFNAQHLEAADNEHCPNCDSGDECAAADQNEKSTGKVAVP